MVSQSDPEKKSLLAKLTAPKMLGGAVAFLGGIVLISWYLYTLELVTLPTNWVPMQYNTAIGFVLTGLAVVAHCVGRRRTALTFGALAAGLGSVALAEQALGRQLDLISLFLGRKAAGSPAPAMAPNTALCFSIAGGLVLVASIKGTSEKWRKLTMGVMASLLAAAGFVGLISFILNNDMAQGWARFTRMDVHTGLAFVGLGVAFFGIVGHFGTRSLDRRLPPWAAWAAGGGVGLLILGIWVGLSSSEERLRVVAMTRTHESAISRANHAFQGHIQDLRKVGTLFLDPTSRNGEQVHQDVELISSDLEGLVGLSVVDGLGQTIFVRDGTKPQDGLVRDLAADPVVERLMQLSRRTGLPSASDPADEAGRSGTFFLCLPLHQGEQWVGHLVAEHDAQTYFDGIFADGVGQSLDIALSTETGGVFYRANGALAQATLDETSLADASAFTGRLAFGDRVWLLNAELDPFLMAGKRSASNTLILWVGIFLAAAIAFAVRKSELLGERAASLEEANRTIEERSESLRNANESLEQQTSSLRATEERSRRTAREKRRVLDSLSAFLVGVDEEGVVTEWNVVSSELFGLRSSETLGRKFETINLAWDSEAIQKAVLVCTTTGDRVRCDEVSVDMGAHVEPRVVSFTVNPTQEGKGFSIIGADVTERRMLEMQLHHSQKLESVGTLAAGIAHEINTPMQFVSDNVRFLSQSVNPIIGVLQLVPGLIEEARKGEPDQGLLDLIEQMLGDVDIDFVADEMPMAIDETLEGVQRVTTIVRAMKDFSHPGSEGVAAADINEAIETTLAVARNEYKYYANVETDFADLGPVECWVADLNQVFLNLLVNGTHAIREKIGDNSSELGSIRVSTRADGDMVEIRFADSGSGIPEAVRSKIFDQFFTTKEVGRGTGLGLAIAHSVVADKHCGTLSFETAVNEGTTFIIRIPFKQQGAPEEHHEAHSLC